MLLQLNDYLFLSFNPPFSTRWEFNSYFNLSFIFLEYGNNEKGAEEEEIYISQESVEFAKEFAKEFDNKMRNEWYMTDWSENPTKISQVQTKIYMFILSKSAKIRELYGNETISKTQILRDQMLNLAKIHYK